MNPMGTSEFSWELVWVLRLGCDLGTALWRISVYIVPHTSTHLHHIMKLIGIDHYVSMIGEKKKKTEGGTRFDERVFF